MKTRNLEKFDERMFNSMSANEMSTGIGGISLIITVRITHSSTGSLDAAPDNVQD